MREHVDEIFWGMCKHVLLVNDVCCIHTIVSYVSEVSIDGIGSPDIFVVKILTRKTSGHYSKDYVKFVNIRS